MTFTRDIYNSFFGKTRQEVLKQFSDENNGKYFSGETEIDDYVVISHLNYKIIFDKYLHYQLYKGQPNDQEYSRVRLEFESPDQLKFNLKLRTYTDSFNELFGPAAIKTRDKQFDRKFVLKGNNESKILAIFKDERIRHLTLKHGELKLGILYNKGMFGEQIPIGKASLYFVSEIETSEPEQMKLTLDLFKALIDKFHDLNSANAII